MDLKRIGLDTSKAVFTLHGVAHGEKAVLRRNVGSEAPPEAGAPKGAPWAGLEAFSAKSGARLRATLPPTLVALEACGASHHWGRRLAALGHTVRLIPPQYVKPFVRRGKNDRNDAEAIPRNRLLGHCSRNAQGCALRDGSPAGR